jgi:hypothetical protein
MHINSPLVQWLCSWVPLLENPNISNEISSHCGLKGILRILWCHIIGLHTILIKALQSFNNGLYLHILLSI